MMNDIVAEQGERHTDRTNRTLASNRPAIERFLDRLRDSGNVRAACHAAGINRSTIYRWRDTWSTFAAEWDEALEDACDILEGEAWRRAMKEGSDRLLMFLLKAHRPDRFKERQQLEHTGEGGDPLVIKLTWEDPNANDGSNSP